MTRRTGIFSSESTMLRKMTGVFSVARANAESERDAARQAQQVAENERDAANAARKETETKLAAAEQNITRLTGELNTAQTKVGQLTTALTGAKGQIVSLEREKRTLKDRLTAEMAKTDPGIASKRIAELNGELAANKAARNAAVAEKATAEKLMVQQRDRADDLQEKLDKMKLALSRRFGKTPEAVPPEIRDLYKESMDELIAEKKELQDSLETQRRQLEERDKLIAQYKQADARRMAAEDVSAQRMLRADKGGVVARSNKGVIALGFEGFSVPERGDVFHATRGGRVVGKATISDVLRTIVVFRVNPGVANKYIEVGDLVSRPDSEE
jgi:chromosome segregation ATPase